jgi:hypothetical protein
MGPLESSRGRAERSPSSSPWFVALWRSSLLNISPLGNLLPYVVSAEAAYMMR